MSIRMNRPHAKTALSYTFILMPVKAQNICSSKIIFTSKLKRYFWNGNFVQILLLNFVTEIPSSKVKYQPLSKNYFWTTNFSSFHWHQYERVSQSSSFVRSIHSNHDRSYLLIWRTQQPNTILRKKYRKIISR